MFSRVPGGDAPSSRTAPEVLLYEEIRNRLNQQEYDTWFRETPCWFQPPNRFVLTARNRFQRAWMEKNFLELIRTSARNVFEVDAQVVFEVAEEGSGSVRPGAERTIREPDAPAPLSPSSDGSRLPAANPPPSFLLSVKPATRPAARPAPAGAEVGSAPARELERKTLHAEYTFENFVVGPSNRVAHAAAIAVSEYPAKTYNPLFIHGELGVGKTHLLHAISHRILDTTTLRMRYFKAEEFLTEYTTSATSGSLEAFRARCREVDVLILDDVHFLSKKEKTQGELFHTFNALIEEQKQMIISSRSHPRDTAGIEARLASRFQWGLVVSIDPPSFQTRVAILMRKAHLRGFELSTEVAEFIARHVAENVRELEGALLRVISLSGFKGASLNMEMARLALQDVHEEDCSPGTVTVAEIIRAVQEYYHLKVRELLARSKARSLVLPRQVGMFLARELTQLSLEEIGVHFGGRDHTTVLYAAERITKLKTQNPQIRADLQLLKKRIAASRYL